MMTTRVLAALKFAARKHRDQRRKNVESSPYINHVIEVASVLASEGEVTDGTLLVAAILHDTVEDTDTTFEELTAEFGPDVSALVREVTDDKTLPKAERKRLQVEHAPGSSPLARQLKIADKVANLRDVAASPPSHWPMERRHAYLDWALDVVAGCRGVNPGLDAAFDATLKHTRASLNGESHP
jgi:guanosine-3',5'-bis(diphosphate) 3'-pyrophosphohydrolase